MEEQLAPMAGNIWKIEIKEGETVSADDIVLIMEAMKMEAEIYAPISGTVTKMSVKEGDAVEEGQSLFTITP